MTHSTSNNWKLKMTLGEYILHLIKEEPRTFTELLQLTGENKNSLRGRLSTLKKQNYIAKLHNDKFDLNEVYKKGLT
jgi:DNA-binding IclR family transcriptional regulator